MSDYAEDLEVEELIAQVNRLATTLTKSHIRRVVGLTQLSYGAYARAIVSARGKLDQFFDPDLFADPAFDIMLDLFACEEEGRTVNISSCAHAARVPATTGLRWVCTLEEKGLVERYPDEKDLRRTLIRLTPHARQQIILYLAKTALLPLTI